MTSPQDTTPTAREEAEALFQQALEIARARGDYDAFVEVARLFREAIRLDPQGHRDVTGHLAFHYFSHARYHEAAETYRQVLRDSPGDREARYYLAQCLERMRDRRAARRLLLGLVIGGLHTRQGWRALWALPPTLIPGGLRLRERYEAVVLWVSLPLIALTSTRDRRFALAPFLRWCRRWWPDSLGFVSYSRSAEYPFAFGVLDLEPGMPVLDIGTGNSSFIGFAAGRGPHIIATDPDACLRELPPHVPPETLDQGLLFAQASGTQLPFADNSLPRVLSISTVEHIPHDGDLDVMKEIARVLAPGGRAVVTTEGYNEALSYWRIMPFHVGFQYVPSEDDEVSNPGGGTSVGFYRFYDEPRLLERLGRVPGLELVEAGYLVDRFGLRRFFPDLPETFRAKVVAPWKRLLGHWAMRRVATPLPPRTNLLGSVGYVILEKPRREHQA